MSRHISNCHIGFNDCSRSRWSFSLFLDQMYIGSFEIFSITSLMISWSLTLTEGSTAAARCLDRTPLIWLCVFNQDKETGFHKGFCWVGFTSEEGLNNALQKEPHLLEGSKVKPLDFTQLALIFSLIYSTIYALTFQDILNLHIVGLWYKWLRVFSCRYKGTDVFL